MTLLAGTARAQLPAAPTCTYHACALTIVPVWNGLAVARGASGPRVANLGFFWPHDVSAVLRGERGAFGADSAAADATRALRLRRIGAALADVGIGVTLAVAARALQRGTFAGSDGALAGAGVAAFAFGVPFQFAADGALSHAVWWHNARYSR